MVLDLVLCVLLWGLGFDWCVVLVLECVWIVVGGDWVFGWVGLWLVWFGYIVGVLVVQLWFDLVVVLFFVWILGYWLLGWFRLGFGVGLVWVGGFGFLIVFGLGLGLDWLVICFGLVVLMTFCLLVIVWMF